MVRIFDIENGQVVPTEHCYTLSALKRLMEIYPNPKDHVAAYAYLFYMTCPDPELNPFFNMSDNTREDMILAQVGGAFSPEDSEIIAGLALCRSLYETPTLRAYNGIKGMLDRLATYMENTEITHGRDGNITPLVNAAVKFEGIRQSFKGAYKDLLEEQKSTVRGKARLSYDS